MEPSIWSKLHGAATHFPIALVLVAAFCDSVGYCSQGLERRKSFRFVGAVTVVLGALGSYPAMISGLVITHGEFWGRATLLRHHQFVWPAFAMTTALATWRVLTKSEPSRRSEIIYLALLLVTTAIMSGAGYWGGELFSEG